MTDTRTHTVPTAARDSLRRPGRWCLVAGLVGVAQGAVVLGWPHQVGDAEYSFPFTATWFVIAQATFFLQHLPLAVAVGVLAGLPAVRRLRWAHGALVVGTGGLGLLALLELIAMSAATTEEDSSLGTVIDSLYSVPVLLTGIGLSMAGAVLLRRHAMDKRLACVLLALGAFVFVGLVPAIATDSFVGGRLAIMAWCALFALLGWLMQRPESARLDHEYAR